jgi:Tudor domain
MINLNNITANFAMMNDNDQATLLPPLAVRTTFFSEGSTPLNGNCAYCVKSNAPLVCEVCFSSHCCTFYCNEDHQRRDWVRHKYDCKPLPKLVLPTEAEAALLKTNDSKPKTKFFVPYVESFKAGDSVIITNVVNERVLFIRPIHEDFKQLIESIKSYAEKAPKITEKPEVNDTVLVPFEGEFCRAQVLDTFDRDADGNDLLCFILDYGYSEKYPWNSLKKLGYKQRAFPRQTFKVILEGVKLQNSSVEIENFIKDIWEREEKLEVVKEEMRGTDRFVVLQNLRTKEVVNDRIRNISKYIEEVNNNAIMYDVSFMMFIYRLDFV